MKLFKRKNIKGIGAIICALIVVIGNAFTLGEKSALQAEALTQITWIAKNRFVDKQQVTDDSLDSNWDVVFSQAGGTAPPTYYANGTAVRMYGSSGGDGSETLIRPSAANSNQVLRKFVLTSASTSYTPTIKVWAGETAGEMVEVVGAAWSGTSYTWTGAGNDRYIKLKSVAKATTQYRITTIDLEYETTSTTYDPVTSIDASVHAGYDLKIGESLPLTPTILPATANQGFTVAVSNPDAVTVSGTQIIGVSAATNVVVTVTSQGKDAGGDPVSDQFTINVSQATTTVEEALTLTPNTGIIYQVTNAKVGGTYSTTVNREITLVGSVNPTDTILIFKYGINPDNSYRYIPGGVISFKATLGTYGGKNQFTEPTITAYTDPVEEFATSILTGDTAGQCTTRFAAYKDQFLNDFTQIEKDKLQNGTDANIVNARARYLAWATALGEKPWEAGATPVYTMANHDMNLSFIFVVIITVLSLAALTYFRKRRYSR